MRWHGWTPLSGIDVSRKDHDKSVIAFQRCPKASVPFACVALSDVDKIRIINWPHYIQERLAEVVRSSYGYGHADESMKDENCRQFILNVSSAHHAERLVNPKVRLQIFSY
jgi:hypothetical protein